MLISLNSEDKNPLSDALVTFQTDDKTWILRGNFDGYSKDIGYIKLPIKGKERKLFSGENVGEIFTANFEKISRTNSRLIWDTLVKEKHFLVDELI